MDHIVVASVETMEFFNSTPNCSFNYNQVDYYIGAVLLSTICVLGVVGNIICLALIIPRYHGQNPFCSYLYAISTFSTLLLASSLCMLGIPRFLGSAAQHRSYAMQAIVLFCYPVGLTFQTALTWLVTAVIALQFFVVRFPLIVHTQDTRFTARILIGSISALAFAFNFSRAFEFTIVECSTDGGSTVDGYDLKPRVFRMSYGYRLIYLNGLYSTCLFVFPFCIQVGCIALIVYHMRISAQNRLQLMGVRHKTSVRAVRVSFGQTPATRNLFVAVSVLFLVCSSPSCLASILELAFVSSDSPSVVSSFFQNLVQIGNAAQCFNASVNYLLYMFSNASLRRNVNRSVRALLLGENTDGALGIELDVLSGRPLAIRPSRTDSSLTG